MISWWLIIGILIISGFVAYLGDKVGRKVGRKKLTIFKLRPRYTSIIITILTGILIAGLSIAIVFSIFSNVRTAFFNMQEVLSQLAALTFQLQSRDAALQDLSEEIAIAENALARIRAEREELQDELTLITVDYERAREELGIALGEIIELEKERTFVEAEKVLLEVEKKELEDVLYINLGRLDALEKQRSSMEQKVDELETMLAELELVYQEMEREYNLRYQELGMLYYDLDQRYQEYAEGNIIYLRGQEIHRSIIFGSNSQQKIVNSLEEFIEEANQMAQNRGAKPHDPETGRSIILYAHEYWTAVNMLQGNDERFIISLIAENNTVPGQEVIGRFLMSEDYVVYGEEFEIMEWIIPENLSLRELEAELNNVFYQLRLQVIEDGILPQYTGQVGSIDLLVLLDLLEKVQGFAVDVKLTVVAQQNIWRGDLLTNNIEFLVEPLGGSR